MLNVGVVLDGGVELDVFVEVLVETDEDVLVEALAEADVEADVAVVFRVNADVDVALDGSVAPDGDGVEGVAASTARAARAPPLGNRRCRLWVHGAPSGALQSARRAATGGDRSVYGSKGGGIAGGRSRECEWCGREKDVARVGKRRMGAARERRTEAIRRKRLCFLIQPASSSCPCAFPSSQRRCCCSPCSYFSADRIA